MADVKQAFVTGYPIKHSRSPLIHGYWLRLYGIAGSYKAIENSPDDFSIAQELAFARNICERNNWPVIDVTRRSIEETAAAILALRPRIRPAD